jgi:hypothetical protein
MRTPGSAFCGLALLLVGGCANGDFGRVKPQFVNDDVHNWVGRQAAREYGHAPSSSELTDDERQLRDLAYPLIEPPYDRAKWDSILYEYGIASTRGPWWPPFDHRAYGRDLLDRSFRSPAGRYAQLIDDIRNDDARIAPFVAVAGRVADMDSKRHRSLAYVSDLPANARRNARRRIAENARIIAWVRHSLRERAAGYRYALERVLVETPSPMAVDAERALRQLRQRIATTRLG